MSAYPRTLTRRKGSKAVRANGRIPANIYGKSGAPQNLEVDAKAFDDLVHRAHSEIILVDLSVTGDSRPERLALVQDVQHHPLHGNVLHVDLHEVKPDEMVTIRVPLESVGTPAGVKTGGGTLEHVLLRVKIRSLPKDLPEQINVDVSALEIGQSIHLSQVKAPAGVEILGNKELTAFAVAAPLTETAEAAAAPAEGGKQPEMIKEKKEDGTAPAAGAKTDDKKAAEKKK
ncbi:MAG TPA: 50S ribosomal protein L25 [Candidatus Limnocylindria bacterium]|nr:50S ribosomal protein L25 [Candidatus Limnocylindria bacterium]